MAPRVRIIAAVWAPSPPEPASLKLMSSGSMWVGNPSAKRGGRSVVAPNAAQRLLRIEPGRWDGGEGRSVRRVLLHAEREDRHHVVPHPVFGGLGLETEVDRTLGEDLDEGEAGAGDLKFERLLDGALGVGPPPVVVESDPFDVDGSIQARRSTPPSSSAGRREASGPLAWWWFAGPIRVVGAICPPVIP